MIYVLIGVGVFVLMVWAGRRARPFLLKRELRIVSGALGGVAMIIGGLLAITGKIMPGGILAALGAAAIFTSRVVAVQAAGKAGAAPDPELTEARDILGVGPGATREEIQAAYGRLIRAVHPDAGGTSGLAARLNAARDVLLRK